MKNAVSNRRLSVKAAFSLVVLAGMGVAAFAQREYHEPYSRSEFS